MGVMQSRIIKIVILLFVTGLSGCGLTPKMQYQEPVTTANHITLVDKRPVTGNETRLERFKALVYYGDTAFTPRMQDLLRNSLAKHSSVALNIELAELSVVQDYGHTHSSTVGSGIIATAMSGGYFANPSIEQGADVMICIASGQVNGKAFKAGAVVPYKANPFSSPIWNDADAQRAARQAIDETAQMIVKKSQ